RPLVAHVHSTELDRTGGHGAHPAVYARERRGLEAADRVVAVSQFTRQKIVDHYGIAPERIAVVHNAIDRNEVEVERPAISARHRIVLFLGRVTIQKGPDWFVQAARRVVDEDPRVLFVIAGSGDMEPRLVEDVASLGLERNVLFTGFLRGEDIDRAYRMADVYVMPSVSEPFGLTPLEAMQRGTPVILSKQSGVSEVVKHCLKVDFWDTEDLAAKILGVLAWRELREELADGARREVAKLSWTAAAEQVLDVYRSVLEGRS
ncbi:MAG: glycosyltransferase family 4 protein, partial [Candidatus Binatia bacterium]